MGVKVGTIRLLIHTLVGICADGICGHTHVRHGAAQLEFVTNMYIGVCEIRLLTDTRIEICGHTTYVDIKAGVLGQHNSSS